MNIKIELNDDSSSEESNLSKAVSKRKEAGVGETLDEAFSRILSMKNSDPQRRKIEAVKKYMFEGRIGRESEAVEKGKKLTKAEVERIFVSVRDMIREDKAKELVEDTPENYEMVTAKSRLEEIVGDALEEEVVAVDTETTGVDVYTDTIVGFSITLPTKDLHVYVPTDHELREGESQLPNEEALKTLSPLLLSNKVGKIFHNAKFDIAMFRRHGYDTNNLAWDTEIAMQLLNENEPNFKLKNLAPKYLNEEADTFDELFGGDVNAPGIPVDVMTAYAAKDTHLTYRLYEFQKEHLSKFPEMYAYYTTVEVPLTYVLVDMEENGYIIDLDYAKEYGDELKSVKDRNYADVISELAPYSDKGEDINVNSTDQMKAALTRYTGKTVENMQKANIKRLSKDFPILEKYLEYKSLDKLVGTYIDALPKRQNPTTKRWHSRFNARGTVTGRFSSGKDEEDKSNQGFNVQNQPPEARPMFLAPEGKVIVGADFKAQEVRCAAYLSGERVLIDGFLNDEDPYAKMAANFYGKSVEECYKYEDGTDTPERKRFKVVWLAMTYGMSSASLAKSLGITKEEAQAFHKEVFDSMPNLSAWLEYNEKFVKRYGYVWADGKQRKRRLPYAREKRMQIPYGKYMDPKFKREREHNGKVGGSLRQATNARVQGSSSIQTKVTMIKAHEYCKQRDGWKLWGTVHDEVLFEVPEDFTRDDAREIERLMTESYTWGDEVPNGTDLEVMKRWGKGVSIDDWFNEK